MSTFETQLYALCIDEIARARNADAKAEVTHVVAAALAATIAAQAQGNPMVSGMVASIIAAELPEMVAKRAGVFRERAQGSVQ